MQRGFHLQWRRDRQDGFLNGFKIFKFNGRGNRGFQSGDCAQRSVSIAHADRLIKIGAEKNSRLSLDDRNCETMNLALTGCENTMEPKRTGQWNRGNSNGRGTMEFLEATAQNSICLCYSSLIVSKLFERLSSTNS